MATKTLKNQSAAWLTERWHWLRELPKALPAHQAILISTAVIAIVADQATKWWVEANIPLRTGWAPITAAAHFFDFFHVPNKGAAFGSFQNLGWLFTLIAFLVCGSILFYNSVVLGRHPAFRIALGLIMGGALGNVIDRLRIGWVTDFIHFDLTPFFSDRIVEMIPLLNFAIFNLADTFIFCGVIIMFVMMWKDTMPDDPWTEEEVEAEEIPATAPPMWVAGSVTAGSDFSAMNRTAIAPEPVRPPTTRSNRHQAPFPTNEPEEAAQVADGRLGLKIALAVGAISLIVAFIIYRRRKKR